jgi:Tfp pilus assembly protein PilF
MTTHPLSSHHGQANRRPAWLLAGLAVFLGLGLLSNRAAQPAGRQSAESAKTTPARGQRLTSQPRPKAPAAKTVAVGEEIRTRAGQRRRLLLPDGSVLYVNQNTRATLHSARRVTLAAGEVFLDAASRLKDRANPFVVKTPRGEVTGQAARFAVRTAAAGPGVVVARGRVQVSGLKRALVAGQQYLPGKEKPLAAPRLSHVLDWTRDLVAAAEAPLVPGSTHTGGALIALDPDGQEAKLSLRKFHVDVHIEDGFARTTIDQTYFNHEPARLEGTFYFPLPADASLSRLAMYVDGNLMEGGMVERDYARTVYETIRYRQQDPALLEWLDGSTFKMRVFPLEPRQEKRILLSYSQKLPSLYGQVQYRFPAGHNLGLVRDWSFHARVKNGAGQTWSSLSHTLHATKEDTDILLDAAVRNARLDQDVILNVSENGNAAQPSSIARFSSAEQDGARYLMVRYRPSLPIRNLQSTIRNPKDWVFLFESSGDRNPLLARTQVEIIRHLLSHAGAGDTFTVLTAGTRARAFAEEPRPATPENAAAAIAFLEQAHLIGALDLGRALQQAQALLKKSKNPYLVHVGSGIAAMGERRDHVLARRIPEGAHYIGIGVGKRWARGFMKAAAERTGGYFTQINPDEAIAWRAFELSATLDTPRLLDVKVAAGDDQARFLTFANTLAQGEELCAVARIGPEEKELPASVKITGVLDGKEFEQVVPVKEAAEKADYLPRTWARLEIERLLAKGAAKHKEQIIALSKVMYVMTPFTSLLVLENEDMYKQYKVDRGRKDHWAMYPAPKKIKVVREDDPERKKPHEGKKTTQQVLGTITIRGQMKFLNRSRQDNKMGEDALQFNFTLDGNTRGLERFQNKVITPDSEIELRKAATELMARTQTRLQTYREMSKRKEQMDLDMLNDTDEFGPASATKVASFQNLEVKRLRNIWEPTRGGTAQGERQAPILRDAYGWRGQEAVIKDVVTGMKSGQGFSISSDSAPRVLEGNADDLDRDKVRRIVEQYLADNPGAGDPGASSSSRRPSLPYKRRSSSLLYQRPSYSSDDRLFFDLVAYAPGMNTSAADIRAVLEAEARPSKYNRPGQIDEQARTLIAAARKPGWQRYTIASKESRPLLTIAFDRQGRYAYARTLPLGLREKVVCDGQTLWHLYPDLGLGTRRQVSRFHRLDFANLVPWAVPGVEDLAHGADLRHIGDRTVALIPHGAALKKTTGGKPVPYRRIHFIFARDGSLAERQIVRMPEKKILYREIYSSGGSVKALDKDGKEISTLKGTLEAADAPRLKADTKDLVVLPLPYRSREHVLETLKIRDRRHEDLRFKDALALLAADFAAGNGNSALTVFQQAFHARDQRQLGFYVLLAACGQNLDADHVDVMAEHPDEPVAQFLALHSSSVLRKHASQWAVNSRQWTGAGILKHLALSHALFQRWQNDKVVKGAPAKRQAERKRAIEYIRDNKGSLFGWILLGLMQDRAGKDKAMHRELVELWLLFEKVPGLAYAARYEQARCLARAGEREAARKRFQDLYNTTLARDQLPLIDLDFRRTLAGESKEADLWSALLRKTAARFIAQKRRPAVLALARQCWQLEDQTLANHLLRTALEDVPEKKGRLPLTLAGIAFFRESGQLAQADQLLRKLLDDPDMARRADLWRIGGQIAEQRDLPVQALECLEKALEVEADNPPEVVDLGRVRREHASLLEQYQNLAQAMIILKIKPPPDFVSKVVRTADRWRALDADGTQACQLAGRILQTLGRRDLSWDYMTTPVALHPNEAHRWQSLAQALARKSDFELADRAYRAAFEAEPTNAELLWERAQNLRQAGKTVAAEKLFRQVAEGKWQPRFQWIQTQARWQVQNR